MLLRAFPGIDHAAVGVIISSANSTLLLRVDGIDEAVEVRVGTVHGTLAVLRSSTFVSSTLAVDRLGPVEMTKPAGCRSTSVCVGGGYTARHVLLWREMPASVAPRRVEGNMNDRVWGPTSRRHHRCWEALPVVGVG